MPRVTFKSKLQSGEPLLGTFLQIPAAEMAEIVGYAGLDFAIVDTEHGMMGLDASRELIRGCDAVGLATIYRVPRLDHHRIGLALDLGASAVMVPNLKSAADAKQVMEAARYYPQGSRGVCIFTRGAQYNAEDEGSDYYDRANRETAVVLQIEGAEGLARLDEILEVPHVDGIFIGPFDLSQSLGIPGQVTHDLVLDAIRKIVQQAERKGIAVGNFAVSIEQARCYMEIGVRFVAYGVDALIAQRAYRDVRNQLKG